MLTPEGISIPTVAEKLRHIPVPEVCSSTPTCGAQSLQVAGLANTSLLQHHLERAAQGILIGALYQTMSRSHILLHLLLLCHSFPASSTLR